MIYKSNFKYFLYNIFSMASAVKNSINFRIRYKTSWGKALYIVI